MGVVPDDSIAALDQRGCCDDCARSAHAGASAHLGSNPSDGPDLRVGDFAEEYAELFDEQGIRIAQRFHQQLHLHDGRDHPYRQASFNLPDGLGNQRGIGVHAFEEVDQRIGVKAERLLAILNSASSLWRPGGVAHREEAVQGVHVRLGRGDDDVRVSATSNVLATVLLDADANLADGIDALGD